ncbi:hypothetical protein GGX14DRAFT_565851 [Mycena pura]|uniref:Uncharacterized protein n=1 Tax=Mycena pura TaxID=153505 RepID=A0AAD6VEW5_9AGAR|nr:hypothetical protein GGX14DRAFT_565851 [Mycena pura]
MARACARTLFTPPALHPESRRLAPPPTPLPRARSCKRPREHAWACLMHTAPALHAHMARGLFSTPSAAAIPCRRSAPCALMQAGAGAEVDVGARAAACVPCWVSTPGAAPHRATARLVLTLTAHARRHHPATPSPRSWEHTRPVFDAQRRPRRSVPPLCAVAPAHTPVHGAATPGVKPQRATQPAARAPTST